MEIYDFTFFFQNFPGKSQVSLCINVTQSNALTIAFSGTSMRDNRPAAGPPSFLLLYGNTSAVTFNEQAWRILKNLA